MAFEIIEKIIRDYFPYITETETTTFTDCVNCLIAFTNSRFNKEISLNAIAFLRFCATKLAEGDLSASSKSKDKEASGKVPAISPQPVKEGRLDNGEVIDKDDHLYFWFPLLAGKATAFLDIQQPAPHNIFLTENFNLSACPTFVNIEPQLRKLSLMQII